MFNRRSFSLSTTLVSLSFILLITIIKDTHGSTEVFHNEEQEFLMDTREHRQILEATYSASLRSNNGNHIVYKGLQPGQQACTGSGCSGKGLYDVGRKCQNDNYSCR